MSVLGTGHYCVYAIPVLVFCFFFKQKTAYEMRISDWSSDVCSSDLYVIGQIEGAFRALVGADSLNGPLCIIPPNRSETALLALVYANELVRVEVLNRGPACKSV